MNIILIQEKLKQKEIKGLKEEFPQYEIFFVDGVGDQPIFDKKDWKRVEILFGNKFPVQELQQTGQLRWIHSPTPYLHEICQEELREQGTILLSNTRGFHVQQISEFVLGSVLSFAKELFNWQDLQKNPDQLWNSDKKEQIWTLTNKIFALVGLGKIGTEIALHMQGLGLKIIGINRKVSFHPYCSKVISLDQMDQILPEADIVCLTLSRLKKIKYQFTKHHLEMLKPGSILILLNVDEVLNIDALIEVCKTGKFKGILLDTNGILPIEKDSGLWQCPNMIITPNIASYPHFEERKAFVTFLSNLRHFSFGNFNEMKNIVLSAMTPN